jgi:hypothetical protein
MKRSGFDEVQSSLDTLNARLDPVEPPINAGSVFLEIGDPHLNLMQIVLDPLDVGFHPSHSILQLSQDRHNDIGNFAHQVRVAVLPMFFKLERLK